ncbi:MAG: SUMF1/EgtB/PvdO family nonheme iron enzyme [Pseudanabaena sp. M090S1SP1A06QC]|nr:SUMF1/EgtB/PvdO family nonheme iron enzyme [Pseudanabaena sp. M109S1SP1A06QC]MCA6604520.1 SUMF1/EgtB/PvdO family nonheme iron enzyme [Pseudanabaena sp. M007S1SP1A06QC]MCA6613243.1 SUMF1/EgtB/PvdO family nonheme iron enzyme [Pseudanabaena sp. M090S1SP1A06QC]
MSNCLCLACDRANSLTTKFCTQCGAKLQIQDRYRALRIIGQGAFGKTFLAQDEGKPSKPKCVIKQFIYNDPSSLQKAQELFEQEAVRLDDLGKHSQIPELFAHCDQDGRQYLVQEFIDGDNLLQELNRAGRFSEAKIKDLLLDLLPVLQFIHAGQVIHRDIKPENIIRRRSDGRLVLVDFGAAKVATKTALQKTATTIGSPEYTPPEQAKGKPVFASDIYALGVTSIYLLTQISPFDLFSDSEFQWVWRQFLNGIVVNDQLGRVLDKMIEQALGKRYQKVEDILQDLDLPKKSPISVPVSPQPVPSVATPPATKPSFLSGLFSQPAQPPRTPVSTSSNSVTLDCGNGVKLELVKVAAGSFNMGSNEHSDEKPIHRVNLQEFLIGKYAVTNAQWQAVMKTKGSSKYDKKFQGDLQPVVGVSWHEARAFCKKLSQQTGKAVRLPTEAEWEYAARGGNRSLGFTYAGSNNLNEIGWYAQNSGSVTHPSGQKNKNEIGIYDMSGNVWEWCLDEWHNSYANKPENLKQQGNQAWGDLNVNENDNRSRALRGGSWGNSAFNCRSAIRDGYDAVIRNNIIGFRVVL